MPNLAFPSRARPFARTATSIALAGALILAWTDSRAAGAVWSAAATLASDSQTQGILNPAIAANTVGQKLAVWVQGGQVQARFYANGAWGAPVVLSQATLGVASPTVALADDGKGGQGLHGWGREDNESGVTDFDDIDDFDGLMFGGAGDFPGPIDAFGQVVPQTTADGTVLLDENDDPVPLEGWTQAVTVEKVSPTDFATVLAHDYKENADPNKEWRDVEDFPLRVTVAVSYQGPFDNSPREITRVVWIVP